MNKVLEPRSPTTQNVASARKRHIGTVACVVIAAGLLMASLKLPLWHMRLEAPQYRDEEALKVAVQANAFRGDLRELAVLNQYIGVHVPSTLPQFKWLPGLLITGAGLGLLASLLGNPLRSRALLVVSCAIAAGLTSAAVQARGQMRDIGHNRDHRTVLVGVKDFTPPILGTNKIAQFTVTSRLGGGAWLIGGALALQLSGAWLSRRRPQAAQRSALPLPEADELLTTAPHSS